MLDESLAGQLINWRCSINILEYTRPNLQAPLLSALSNDGFVLARLSRMNPRSLKGRRPELVECARRASLSPGGSRAAGGNLE